MNNSRNEISQRIVRLLPIVKRSAKYSFTFVAFVNTVLGVIGYTIRDIDQRLSWIQCILILFGLFILVAIGLYLWLSHRNKRAYTTKVNGCKVEIKVGNLFDETDWKVIGFNEFFDTEVGNGIIEEESLNGIMIADHVKDDLPGLKARIEQAKNDSSPLKPTEKRGKLAYPLGRVIDYDSFIMVALSHFDDQNVAFIDLEEYEQILMRFWKELRRVYNGKHVAIPLLGTGVMDIRGMPEKDYNSLLHCILCSLSKSTFQPKNGLSVILTDDAMSRIDMNAIREEF